MRSPPSTGSGECDVNCSGELNPMISPTESSRVAACESMGLPHLIVALGCTRPARRVVRGGPAAERVTWKESLCAKATKERRVSAVVFDGCKMASKGLSRPWCKRSFSQDLRGV